jgi:hypothetical protein
MFEFVTSQDDSGKYYSGCKETALKRNSTNEDDQKKLWEMSEKMVGIGKRIQSYPAEEQS